MASCAPPPCSPFIPTRLPSSGSRPDFRPPSPDFRVVWARERAKEAKVQIAYMPDTHGGPYNQPEPSREAAAKFCDQLLNEGIEAERAGFDGIFLPERHHRTETMFPPPLVMLAAYAARTTKVDLGTFVLQPPYYNPMHLAEDVAM